jgi:hypothetical protein
MSMPPQGGWQPTQPPAQGGWQPPQQPPAGWQQGPLAQQPGPPPQKGNSVKWLLVAIAVLLVIGVTIGATLLFTRGGGGSGGPTPTTSGAAGDIASANDTGPVAIITDESTCQALNGINSILADVQANGWSAGRAGLGPAASWTADQRTQVQAVTTAMSNAADQIVGLAKRTPHRVIRELYEQFIAYGRAYVDSVPNYVPTDNFLADVNVSIGNALLGVCDVIEYGSANRALALAPIGPPNGVAAVGDPGAQQRFVRKSDSTCLAWNTDESAFLAGTNDWEKLDSNIPGSQWTPEQRATQQAALPVMTTFANNMESTGRQSGNPVFEDFALLAASYLRAYVSAGDNYTSADSWLIYTTLRLNNAISSACKAAAE